MIEQWRGVIIFISGFENNTYNGESYAFNFILSNGERSTQIDRSFPTKYTHMMPQELPSRIRRVTIHYRGFIRGFSFFDKDGVIIWKHGDTWPDLSVETVMLAENEVIMGVKAKLYDECQSIYTDFQFQIAARD